MEPAATVEKGIYKVTFYTKEYFERKGVSSFYPYVEVSCESLRPSCRPIAFRGCGPDSELHRLQIPFEVKVAEEHYRLSRLALSFAERLLTFATRRRAASSLALRLQHLSWIIGASAGGERRDKPRRLVEGQAKMWNPIVLCSSAAGDTESKKDDEGSVAARETSVQASLLNFRRS
jgi:hypothetical protein